MIYADWLWALSRNILTKEKCFLSFSLVHMSVTVIYELIPLREPIKYFLNGFYPYCHDLKASKCLDLSPFYLFNSIMLHLTEAKIPEYGWIRMFSFVFIFLRFYY